MIRLGYGKMTYLGNGEIDLKYSTIITLFKLIPIKHLSETRKRTQKAPRNLQEARLHRCWNWNNTDFPGN